MSLSSTAGHRRPAPLVAAAIAPLAIALALATAAPAVASTRHPHAHHVRHDGLPPKRVWLRDVSRALSGVPTYLDARAREGGRLAVVLGIDNVALASHYDWPESVPPTLRVARHARQLGMAVFFVTGRLNRQEPHLRRLLRHAGFSFDGVCGRAPGVPIPVAKQQCRRAIADRGYTITANIASNGQAFHGGYYERAVLLPDYGGRLG